MSTPQFKSEFLQVMHDRGAINQSTDLHTLDRKLTDGVVTAYVGFDATADSLHVGHLVSIMALRRLAQSGHKVIALMGGATTLVGDPSFRSTSRPMLSAEDVARNIEGISANITAVLGPFSNQLTVVNNSEWLGDVGFIEFMRSVGSHFTIARMLSMEAVKSRLEDGLTMLEFSYMMLQSADFLELSRRHDCSLQMGGSDQWGNITNGIDLARRSDGKELMGLTTPLLTTANGEKMGKTANGAVWLSAEKLDPFQFWQFWRNVPDADVEKLLLLFSDIPREQIEMSLADVNSAKSLLANIVTELVHGKAVTAAAEERSRGLFGKGEALEPLELSVEVDGIGVLTLMNRLGFCATNNEARRLIEGGGVKINDAKIDDPKTSFAKGVTVLISSGKKKRELVHLV